MSVLLVVLWLLGSIQMFWIAEAQPMNWRVWLCIIAWPVAVVLGLLAAAVMTVADYLRGVA